jgi:protein-S-isoprenylcysteine O-methyltransferase Ste14
MKKPFTTIAAVIFVLMALVHIFRLAFGWEVTIQGSVIPMWVSALGVILAGGLAVLLWRESR